MKSTPSGETRQFKLFGSGPIEAESTLIERAVKRLDDIVALASSGPTVIAVEALTSQEARRVIEAWLSRQKSPAPTVLRLQPWRSNAQDVDLRILISSQLIQECRASDGSNKVGALLGLGTARESADLYRWLQSGSWSPVMQAELDGVVREWLRQLPDHQRFFVVIEGIEKCQPPPVQETCYKVLASLLRDPRAITLIDSKVSKDLSEAWKVDASIEVPTLSPPRFQRWILQLLGLSAVTNDGSHESSVRWARIISDASYPYLFKAKRIVNDIALSADQAVDALAEEINDHHSTNRAPLEGQR